MFRHRVERKRERLVVTIELDLAEVAHALATPTTYQTELEAYCANHVVPDVFGVTEILLQEDDTLGVVKWFNDARGYGFIRSYSGKDVFVHYRDITGSGYRTLEQGQRVRFKCRVGEQQRLSAVEVEPLTPTLPVLPVPPSPASPPSLGASPAVTAADYVAESPDQASGRAPQADLDGAEEA